MKKTKKPTSKDYEKIISIQERIIKAKESEFKQMNVCFYTILISMNYILGGTQNMTLL